MRKIIALVSILLPIVTFAVAQQAAQPAQPASTPATNAPSANPMKIGFVNSYDVLYGTEQGKQALDSLNQLMQQKQTAYDTQKTDLDKLRGDLEQKQRNLNPETAAEMNRTIEEKTKALTRFQEDAQAEITRRRDEVLGSISERASKIINDYAQQNNFGAIFLRDQQVVTYVASALDVTPDIIKLYNQQFPAAARPATSSNAPATAPAAPAPAPPKK